MLRHQAGGLAQASGHRSALVEEVGTGFRVQRLDIDNRIINKPARKLMAQRRAPAFFTVRHMFADQRAQSLFERFGRLFRCPSGRATYSRQHAG